MKVDTVCYWSDGPLSQFKNQFSFTNLWFSDFATSHGNGENDGVGGHKKNAVWCKTLQMEVLVTNLIEFVEIAQKKFSSFVIVAFNSAEVWSDTNFLMDCY